MMDIFGLFITISIIVTLFYFFSMFIRLMIIIIKEEFFEK